jgi:lysophospholipase L1-like esterase
MKENNYNSRRKFIRGAAFTGIAACCMPSLKLFAAMQKEPDRTKLKEGSVILFQGDSITDGNRGRNEDPNHIMGHGYAFSIASRVGADYPEKHYRFYNRGISGNKVTDLKQRWQADTLDLKPDVLSILVGVNDANSVVFNRQPSVSVEQYQEVYDALLEKTRALFPDIILVLGEPFVLKVGRMIENWEASYSDMSKRQAAVRELAKKFDAVFVGFQEVFDKACEKTPASYWIWDGVHPTVPGHELMAREWIKQVEKRISF